MYIMGGDKTVSDSDCVLTTNRYCTDVQRAPINANGTLGAWSLAGTGSGSNYYSAVGRDGLGAYAFNNFLYVFGGTYSNNRLVSTEVNYAPIDANGVLGNWSTSST